MSGLYAHIADEVHEHAANGEVIWHHAARAPEVHVTSPLLLLAGAIALGVAIVFVAQRLMATRPTTAMRSTSA